MKYRKKPIVVEAEQFFLGKPHPFDGKKVVQFDSNNFFVLDAASRKIILQSGDWVILEQHCDKPNRAYPCTPEVFAQTYEPVPENGLKELAAGVLQVP